MASSIWIAKIVVLVVLLVGTAKADQVYQDLLEFKGTDVPNLDTLDYLAISVALDELEELPHDKQFTKRALVHQDLLESAARDQGELIKKFPKAHRIQNVRYHLLSDTVLHPIREIKARKGTLNTSVLRRFLKNYKTLYEGYIRGKIDYDDYISQPALDHLALNIRARYSVNATGIEDFRKEFKQVLKTWVALGDKGLIDPNDIDAVKGAIRYLNSKEAKVLRRILGAKPDESLFSKLRSELSAPSPVRVQTEDPLEGSIETTTYYPLDIQ